MVPCSLFDCGYDPHYATGISLLFVSRCPSVYTNVVHDAFSHKDFRPQIVHELLHIVHYTRLSRLVLLAVKHTIFF
jgi:hypothetical protein